MSEEALYETNPVRANFQQGTQENANTIADKLSNLNLFADEEETPQAPKEQPAAEEDDQETDVDPQSEDSGDAPETETKSSDKEEEAETPDEEEETPIESIHQLAEALEVADEDLQKLEFTFKANGQENTVQLNELVNGYQRQADYTRKQQEFAEQRRVADQQALEKTQQLERETVQLGQMLQQAKNILVGEFNTPDMQALRSSNPAEWSARAHEMQTRINQVDQLYTSASQQYQQYQDTQGAAQLKQAEEHLSREMDKLRTELPNWGDGLRTDIVSYLNTAYGFTGDDFNNVTDSRLILMANKAMLYDKQEKVTKQVKKTVKTLPKVGQGKKAPPKRTAKQANYAKARARLKQTGKTRDAAELFGYLNID